jgi:CRP-like cAMP-binding protein
MKEERHSRGAVLTQEGVPPSKVRLVVGGRVRNERRGRVLSVAKPPTLVGIGGVLGGRTASLRSVAETSVTLLSIDAQDFLDVLEDRFAVFLQLRRFYAESVVRLQRRLAIFHTSGPLPDAAPEPGERPLNIVEQLLFLQKTSVFSGIPVNVIAQLVRGDREVRMEPGEVLWNDGDAGTQLVVIVHGHVRCGAEGAPGSFVAGRGYVLGADATFGGIPYSYDAVAVSPVVAITVAGPALTDMIEDHFELGRRSLAHFAQEEVRLQERAAQQGA